jgi:hypothetical protein
VTTLFSSRHSAEGFERKRKVGINLSLISTRVKHQSTRLLDPRAVNVLPGFTGIDIAHEVSEVIGHHRKSDLESNQCRWLKIMAREVSKTLGTD